MKIAGTSIFFTLLLFSCVPEDKIPEYVIGKEQMAKIILDINIADARMSRNGSSDGTKVWQREKDLELIAKKYNLPDSVIKKSYDFYITHPKIFKEVLALSLEKAEKLSPVIEIKGANSIDSLVHEEKVSVNRD